MEEKQLNKLQELKIPILNNVALCLMKMEKYVKANQMIDQVLALDKGNFKAWLRKASNIIKNGGNLDEARAALKGAEECA